MKIADIMQPNAVTVVEGDTLSMARQVMLWHGIRHLIVLRDGRPVGVLSERDIIAHVTGAQVPGELQTTVGEVMSSPVEFVHPSATLADAAAVMASRTIGCLPVQEEGELVGIVTNTDLLSNLAQAPVPAAGEGALSARDLMSTKLYAVMPDGFLLDAVATMVLRGIRHLVVVDGLGRVVGMISDRDVRNAVGQPREALELETLPDELLSTKIRDVMTSEPRVLREDTSLAALVDALLADRYGALPVVDAEDRLVGVVSYVDVLHHIRGRLRVHG
jgi:CBS domain-containing protein